MIEEIIKGKVVTGFAVREHGFCFLGLTDGYSISIETMCRFIGRDGEFISSEDHGELFGLPAPFDASTPIENTMKGKTIEDVDFSSDTGDLTLHFADGRLEVVSSSSGYESYQIDGPGGFIVVVRGGKQ